MKKNILIALTILSGLSLNSFGQKLVENKTDDFTNKSVKRTSWETLCSSSMDNTHFRLSLVGDLEIFDLKLMMNKAFSIDKDREINFKLDNGEIVTVKNNEYTITCNGCGATGLAGSEGPGIQTSYLLSKEQVEKLKLHKIVKVRITTDDGSFDEDVKDKNAVKIMACFNLI